MPRMGKASVGSFTDPQTGVVISVIPKQGESASHAMARVRARHDVRPTGSRTGGVRAPRQWSTQVVYPAYIGPDPLQSERLEELTYLRRRNAELERRARRASSEHDQSGTH
jgi:hypothetical protein